jgi:dolichol kinase
MPTPREPVATGGAGAGPSARVVQPLAPPASAAPPARPVPVPRALEVATAWSWRLLVVAVAVYVFAFVVLDRVRLVAVPLLLAVLVAALLSPLYRGLVRGRVPRYPAAGLSVAVFVMVLGLAATVVSQQIATDIGDFGASAGDGLTQTLAFVADLLGVSLAQVEASISDAVASVVQESTGLVSGALTATGTATSLLTGLLLTLFAVFFYLSDGAGSGRSWSRSCPATAAPAPTWPAGGRGRRSRATCGRCPWSRSSTRWASASGRPRSVSPSPCRSPSSPSSAPSSRWSGRSSPGRSRSSSRW